MFVQVVEQEICVRMDAGSSPIGIDHCDEKDDTGFLPFSK